MASTEVYPPLGEIQTAEEKPVVNVMATVGNGTKISGITFDFLLHPFASVTITKYKPVEVTVLIFPEPAIGVITFVKIFCTNHE